MVVKRIRRYRCDYTGRLIFRRSRSLFSVLGGVLTYIERGGLPFYIRKQLPPHKFKRVRRRPLSIYGKQLREQKKLRFFYALRNRIELIKSVKFARRGYRLVGLELKRSNLFFRTGLFRSVRECQRIVTHLKLGNLVKIGEMVHLPQQILLRKLDRRVVGYPSTYFEFSFSVLKGVVFRRPRDWEVYYPFSLSVPDLVDRFRLFVYF